VYQDTGRAAAGAGQHQPVPGRGTNGLALGILQGIKNTGYIHMSILPDARSRPEWLESCNFQMVISPQLLSAENCVIMLTSLGKDALFLPST